MYVGKGKFCRKFLWCWLGLSLPSTFAQVFLPHSLSVHAFLLFLTRNDKIVFQKEAYFKACGSIWGPVDTILHLGKCVSATYPWGRSHPISQSWEWEMVPDVVKYPPAGTLPLFENHWYSPSFPFTMLSSPMDDGNWGGKTKSSPCGFSPHDLPSLP